MAYWKFWFLLGQFDGDFLSRASYTPVEDHKRLRGKLFYDRRAGMATLLCW